MFYNILTGLLTSSKKTFTKSKSTNIVITGGVQGLGKDLARKFAVKHEIGSVNLIIIDIAEHLAEGMIADIKSAVGSKSDFKYVHFIKCNIACKEEVDRVWKEIVAKHGPVHILVNNAARALGKTVEQLGIDQFKLTMDINFISYVQFSMLFMA